MLTRQENVGKRNWATSVKNLLYTYGFGFVWLSQEIICQFKQRIIDCKTQNWMEEIQNSPRCDTYKFFKSMLSPEKYLSLDMPFYVKRTLSRFR
jgi:hypothetical protein